MASNSGIMKGRSVRGFILGLAACLGTAGWLGLTTAFAAGELADEEAGPRLVVPLVDSAKGKRLFVDKGCVLCHSVNKVGGVAAAALDAPQGGRYVDLTEFMARMWRGAFAMIELQGMELGYQLDFTGAELGHIAAFLSDAGAQKGFYERDVPDIIRDMFIREPYEMGEGLKVPGQQ